MISTQQELEELSQQHQAALNEKDSELSKQTEDYASRLSSGERKLEAVEATVSTQLQDIERLENALSDVQSKYNTLSAEKSDLVNAQNRLQEDLDAETQPLFVN